MDFKDKVWAATRRIPKGKVTTYKILAQFIKSPNASRAVGNALSKNPNTSRTPCHRVIRSNGFVGGYALGTKNKIKKLANEGVQISNAGFVDSKKYLFSFK
jgi:methylated-DNA-[protein]-cysteine S-methyltransferase